MDEPASLTSGTVGASGWVEGLPTPADGSVRLPMSPTLTTDGKMSDSTGTPHMRTSSLEGIPTVGQIGSSPASASQAHGTSSSTPAHATTSTATRPGHVRMPSSTKIRFAPLPTPNRKRSLSTGRIVTKAKLEPDGTRTMERFSDRADGGNDSWVSDENEGGREAGESAVQDEEDDEEEDDEEDTGKTSSWKTMGMSKKRTSSITSSSYTYTKKLFKPFSSSGGGEEKTAEEPSSMTFGSPLRKTLSTGGMMGSSPFRSAGEQDRRRSFLSTGSLMGNSKGDSNSAKRSHMRNGSSSNSEKPDFSSLSSSLGYKAETEFAPSGASMPKTDRRPVKMLNGRVYGGNKAGGKGAGSSTSAEPEFSEWGGLMGAGGGGLGSNQSAPRAAIPKLAASGPTTAAPIVKKSGFLDDADDGSGMGWVKRRREQRERERRASEQAPPAMNPSSSGDHYTPDPSSSTDAPQPLIGSVPAVRVTPPHWPETFSPDESERSLAEYISARPTEATIMEETSVPGTPRENSRSGSPAAVGLGGAIRVPPPSRDGRDWTGSRGTGGDGSAVEDDSESDSAELEGEVEEEDEDEEEGDRGDFESDSEDEVELDMEGLGQNAR